ncbi:hypothetical protein AAVH_25304 [Aphelenchoides avenae]|nr:hypothetical protein AAVH_25304 [Aphelenchus avenae]
MTKLVAACKARQSAFASADFKKLMCLPTYRQAELKLIVAERVRAEIDGKKSLRSDPVIVLGGHNAQTLSDVLGASFVEAPTVPDLRSFFESNHFQAAVQQIFVWLDPDHEQFVLAHHPQLVETLRSIIMAAAKWAQIEFVILPVTYAASLLPTFNAFMAEFNKVSLDLPNVLWLNDAKRVDGARFTHSLGVNAFIADFSTLSKTGRIARRSARAALRFLRELKPSLIPEHLDLSDPLPPQQSTSSSTSSSSPALHDVRHGKIQKPYRDHISSRGGTNKRGGGGGRGKWSNDRQGQGARRH